MLLILAIFLKWKSVVLEISPMHDVRETSWLKMTPSFLTAEPEANDYLVTF